MRWPLLWVAICFTLGILAAYAVSVPTFYLLPPSFALLLAAFFWPRARLWMLAAVLFLAGAVNFTLRTAALAPDDLRTILKDEPREGIIRGKLVDTPYQRVFGTDGMERWRTMARVQVEAICLNERWSGASGEIVVTTPEILSQHFYDGQGVQIQGIIRPPRGALAPGTFDYGRYLKTLGIHYQLAVASTNDWQLLSTPTALPLTARFAPWARAALARGLPEDRYVELLWAMTLGWKTALSGEVAEPFMRSGTLHVFAISGLHIALIAAILVASFKLIGFRLVTCAWIVIPLIWLYTMATGWQASAIRSTIMSSVIIFGYLIKRPSNLLNSLMAAGLLILIWDPLQLFQAGFQLSFLVVLSIGSLMPPLNHFLQRKLEPDPFLPPQFRPRRLIWGNTLVHYFIPGLGVSLAAWLGSLPLIAYYFHLLTPITLIANMVVVPLSSGALACNIATLALASILPPAAELLNHCAWFFMVLMVAISEWAAGIDIGVYHVKVPTLTTFVIYYALLIAIFSGWLFRPHLRWRLSGAMAAAVIPFAGSFWSSDPPQVTVLPLEGGTAIYIKHQDEWLVDCGNLESGQHITKPFLQSRGMNRLPHLLLTHGDVRHVQAAPLIHEVFSPRNIYMSPIRFRSLPYRHMQAYFQTNNIPIKTVAAGDRLGTWEVLHPDPDTTFPQADDNAIVLYGKIFEHRILLLSDLGAAGQNALLERHPNLNADILITGLPRQSQPVADGFLAAVQPRLIIIADAQFPAPDRASPRLRARLANQTAEIIYTSDSAAVTVTFHPSHWNIQTMASGNSVPNTD